MFGSTEGEGVAQFSQFLLHTLITGTFFSFVNAFRSETSVPLLTKMTGSTVITGVLFWHITTKQTVLAQGWASPYNHNAVYIQNEAIIASINHGTKQMRMGGVSQTSVNQRPWCNRAGPVSKR